MGFEYRCVAGPTIVAVKSAKARDQAVKAFEEIINAEARQGWEYVGIDEFHVSEPQGLLNRKRVYVPSKILVFRRPTAAAAAPVVVQPTMVAPRPAPPPAEAPRLATPAAAAEEPKDSPEFREALQAMTEKLRASKS